MLKQILKTVLHFLKQKIVFKSYDQTRSKF